MSDTASKCLRKWLIDIRSECLTGIIGIRSKSGTHEPIVFRMRTDPKPGDRILSQCAESPMVRSDANTESIGATLLSAEVQERMMRIAALDC